MRIRYASKECNKCAATALISVTYRAPHFDAIPESAPSCKAPQSLDCGTFPVKMQRVLPNCGAFGKKCCNTAFHTCRTNPEANHKVWCVSYQSTLNQFYKLVAFFLTHTVYGTVYIPLWMYTSVPLWMEQYTITILLTYSSKLLKLRFLTQYIHHFQHSTRIRTVFLTRIIIIIYLCILFIYLL